MVLLQAVDLKLNSDVEIKLSVVDGVWTCDFGTPKFPKRDEENPAARQTRIDNNNPISPDYIHDGNPGDANHGSVGDVREMLSQLEHFI